MTSSPPPFPQHFQDAAGRSLCGLMFWVTNAKYVVRMYI
jgi:hypothetical protein